MSDLFAKLAALSADKRALLARTLGVSHGQTASEQIAIIGMACRFPGPAGDLNTPEAFWQMLVAGGDAITELSAENPAGAASGEEYEQDARAALRGSRSRPGRARNLDSTRRGAFLTDIDRFDARFFGISPREAESMDPQHRLFLEVAIWALEDARQPAATLAGSRTGVFAAVYQRDHLRMALADPARIDAYTTSGIHHGICANRLSYVLDLRGPSLVVDTACSSSLVAVHLAAQSLRRRECDLAVVGAANMILAPEETLSMARWGMLAADGRCKPFDARADGFVRGEGVAVVVLARLDDALARGEHIHAVIAGSAVNQDGRSNGLTAPSVAAQTAVIRAALADAGMSAAEIGYVETHGTGTALGDPIEVEALVAALGSSAKPCLLGAVKSNIGHLEAAAGMAGLIKAVLALRHEAVPRNLHVHELNPAVAAALAPAGRRFVVPTELEPWPRAHGTKRTRRAAGVSSFGMGGTNAHVILTEPPAAGEIADTLKAAPRATMAASQPSADTAGHAGPGAALGPRPRLLPLSARSAAALHALAHQAGELASAGTWTDIDQLCAAAALGRSQYEHRLAVVTGTAAELAERLSGFASGNILSGVVAGKAVDRPWHGVVFVFSGQGGQWTGMGQRLFASEPVFRAACERCAQAAAAVADGSTQAGRDVQGLGAEILAALAGTGAGADAARMERLQPLMFTIQVALAELWRSWGIEPDAVIGHSMGEVAAAHVAGALELEDAMRVICTRSRLLAGLTGNGAMVSVALDTTQTAAAIAPYAEQVAIAAENGPEATVIAGEPAALAAVISNLEARGNHCRYLAVDVAAHSPAIEPLLPVLVQALDGITARAVRIPLYSTVTGRRIDSSTGILDARYWAANVREPVRFWPAARTAMADGYRIFVEISPHPTLLPALSHDTGDDAEPAITLLASMRKDEDERATMLTALGALYTAGVPVRWQALYPGPVPRVPLPHYPFQRERFWQKRSAAYQATLPGEHPLLGTRLDTAPLTHSAAQGSELWTVALDTRAVPFLRDHVVQGAIVVPGTAIVEMVLAAARARLQRLPVYPTEDRPAGVSGHEVVARELRFEQALVLDEDAPRIVQIVLQPRGAQAASVLDVRVYSRDGDDRELAQKTHTPWTLHARGLVEMRPMEPPPICSLAEIRARCERTISGAELYAAMAACGNLWGPAFQGIVRLAWRAGEALADITAPSAIAAELDEYVVHPALLDACGQALSFAAGREPGGEPGEEYDTGPLMLESLREVRVYGPLATELIAHITVTSASEPGSACGTVRVTTRDGQVLVELVDLRIRFIEQTARALSPGAQGRPERWLYAVSWPPVEPAQSAESAHTAAPAQLRGLLILADASGVGRALADLAVAENRPVAIYEPGTPPAHAFAAVRGRAPGPSGENEPRAWDIVHLGALDVPDIAIPDLDTDFDILNRLNAIDVANAADSAETAVLALCTSALAFARELIGMHADTHAHRLWLVTRGGQAVTQEDTVHPVHTALWGLGRALEAEAPAHLGRLIDLDPQASPQDAAAALWRELHAPGSRESQIAYRDSVRYAARLARVVPQRQPSSLQIAADRSYLITGGLGDLGLASARWLVEQGARHIVLMSRTALPPRFAWRELLAREAVTPAGATKNAPAAVTTQIGNSDFVIRRIRAILALEAMGAAIALAAVDVGDAAAVTAFLHHHAAELRPRICGVIHAAGTQHPGAIEELTLAALAADARAKVRGSVVLSRSLPDMDFLLCFSSAATVLGSPFLAGYAAANAFMDGLAHAERARGQHICAVDWGFWDGSAMVARYEQARGSSAVPHGMDALAPAQAFAALQYAMGTGLAQVAVLPVRWDPWLRAHAAAAERPIFDQLRRLHQAEPHAAGSASFHDRSTAPPAGAATLTRSAILAALPEQRMERLASYLGQVLGRVLGMAPAKLPMDEPLIRLGLDSLMAIEIRNRITTDLGVRVPIVRILGCPSALALAAELATILSPDNPASHESSDSTSSTDYEELIF